MVSLNLIMIWFIDEYMGALSKDNTEKFAGATTALMFNRLQEQCFRNNIP